jgi:hypothetical protein
LIDDGDDDLTTQLSDGSNSKDVGHVRKCGINILFYIFYDNYKVYTKVERGLTKS